MVNQVGTDAPLVHRRWWIKRRLCGAALVAVHNNNPIECRVSCKTSCQQLTGSSRVLSANKAALHKVPFKRSTCPFPPELYGVVRLDENPFWSRKSVSCVLMKPEPLSEWIKAGTPKMENNWHRHSMMDCALTTLHGKAKGNLEYSSITVSINLFWLFVGKGPLKSKLSRSKGWVAFIKCDGPGWTLRFTLCKSCTIP